MTTLTYGQVSKETKALTVEYCDLIKKPEEYTGSRVRVTAIYRYGMYWSEVYCLECDSSNRISVSFADDFDSNTKKKYRKKIPWSDLGRTVRITAIGRLSGPGNYGHRGNLRFQLEIERLESAEVISRAGDYVVAGDGGKCLANKARDK